MSSGQTTSQHLIWFARHELRIAWRDWLQMMSGGYTRRDRVIVVGTLAFFALLHVAAYALMKGGFAAAAGDGDHHRLIIVSALVLTAVTMMMAQAIEQITRVFYARADLDLILSSPTAAEHLFAVRIAAVAVVATGMTALLASPLINAAAIVDGPHWLAAYGVIAALAMIATAAAVGIALLLFSTLGARRTRLAAQITAAVIGAALLIGLQVVAILNYGNLSRADVLNAPWLSAALPDAAHPLWWPARAVIGEPFALLGLIAFATLVLLLTIATTAHRFAGCSIAAAGAGERANVNASRQRPFATSTPARALRRKEWQLLARDPWLASQTVMQVLYLIPPAILLWRDNGDLGSATIATPVLVMAFGQLAGGLSWLALSGEDASDLLATAPVQNNTALRAKIEAVLTVIVVLAIPLTALLCLGSVWAAACAFACIVAASPAAIAIQMWFRSAAKRSQFRRRQTASRAATFSEAFSSIFWAITAGFSAAGSWFALLFAALALATLAAARALSPDSSSRAVIA